MTDNKETELAWSEIVAERSRQVHDEGWDAAHDDAHDEGELLSAAVLYIWHGTAYQSTYKDGLPMGWPWDAAWWKPKDRHSNLVRAGALCLAERDRLVRAKRQTGPADHKLGIALRELVALSRRPAATSEAVADEWQDIATRPTDDTLFYAYCPPDRDFPEGRTMIWRGNIFPGASGPNHLQFPATHWRPLPPPPTQSGDAK